MRTLRLAVYSVASLIGLSTVSHAIDFTYISTFGADSASCERGTPCRTLNYALGQTDVGGTITMLDAGEYSPVTVGKSVTIQGQGPDTRINNSSSTGVTVSGTGTVFVLRDVSISGDLVNPGQNGVEINDGLAAILENVAIENQVALNYGVGLRFASSQNGTLRLTNVTFNNVGNTSQVNLGAAMVIASPFGGKSSRVVISKCSFDKVTNGVWLFNGEGVTQLSMEDTTISHAAGNGLNLTGGRGGTTKISLSRSMIADSAGDGIYINPGAGTNRLTIADSQIVNNGGTGVYVAPTGSAGADVTVMNSTVSQNTVGIRAQSAAKVRVAVNRTAISNNGVGLSALGPAVIRVGSSVVAGNSTALAGNIASYGNNQIDGNTTQGSKTPVGLQSVP